MPSPRSGVNATSFVCVFRPSRRALPPRPPPAPQSWRRSAGQWSSTAAMGNYLHDDEEGKQEAQIKRIKQRAKSAKQEARK